MPHHHVRLETVGLQQLQQGGVQRQHRRLSDRRLHQVKLRPHQGVGVAAVHKDVLRQRLAQNGRHHPVRFAENFSYLRRCLRQFAPHVHVLAALTGEEEGDFPGGRAAAAKDALRFQRLPRLRIIKAHDFVRLLQAGQQFVVVAKVNHQPFAGADCFRLGQRQRRRPPPFHALYCF